MELKAFNEVARVLDGMRESARERCCERRDQQSSESFSKAFLTPATSQSPLQLISAFSRSGADLRATSPVQHPQMSNSYSDQPSSRPLVYPFDVATLRPHPPRARRHCERTFS